MTSPHGLTGVSVVTVSHNFETAHRLPFLGGKCQNLHGHSWEVEVGLANPAFLSGINEHGISIEYGLAKKVIRSWIDDKLDHGTMLGTDDALARSSDTLDEMGKVFIFGRPLDDFDQTLQHGVSDTYLDLPWPTVEAVARMLHSKLQAALTESCGEYIMVDMIRVEETEVNASLYIPDTTHLEVGLMSREYSS